MKNKVEYIHEQSSQFDHTMNNVKSRMNSVIEKYNKDGYKVISTEFIKDVTGSGSSRYYDFRIFIVFEKIE